MLSDWNDDMTTPPACTVYFDGDCPVCRTEIAHYRRQRGAEAIAWVDASSCDDEALGPGVDRAMVLRRFHVRVADGSLASGAAGFVAIWRRLPAFAWLATLASYRPVLAALEAGYRLFLRARAWWRLAGTAAPATRDSGFQPPTR
jgi:predicted DCC family thiol-disulfide oxidoreductase YuxK